MANNKVDVGDHSGPFSPTKSQGASSPGTSETLKQGKSQRRQSSPVISDNGSEDHATRGQRSQTISASLPSPSLDLRNLSIDKQPQQEPMAPPIKPETYYTHEVDNILRKVAPSGRDMAEGFALALEHPPITSESLAELDMARIINNPKLRHDVNFDRELHFRPNLDGSKGQHKLESAEKYWKALQAELFMCGYVQARKNDADYAEKEDYWENMLAASLRRLPNVFKGIKDILRTLVPKYDQQAITDRLDLELIMREISHGVCDLVDLANWLRRVLKTHCAPMRDELVDRTRKEIIRGATEKGPQGPAKLVKGLRLLLSVLEAMKLDVANHQVRHMRSMLVENSFEFLSRYHAHRARQGKIEVLPAKLWAERAMSDLRIASAGEIDQPTYLDGICYGLIRAMLYPSHLVPQYPAVFYLDAERLKVLQLELRSAIYHQICNDVLTDFCGAEAPTLERERALAMLQISLFAIVGPTCQFEENRENIAAEIMRIGLILEGRADTTYDALLLDRIEERLEIELQFYSAVYERYAGLLTARLVPSIQEMVAENIHLGALPLQNTLVPPMLQPSPMYTHALSYGAMLTPGIPVPLADPEDDILRRFTHIVAFHWHVWADICYLPPRAELEVMESPSSDGSEPRPPPSTVPVAQAVYAPGHKWLPVGVTVVDVPPAGFQASELTLKPRLQCESKGKVGGQGQGEEVEEEREESGKKESEAEARVDAGREEEQSA